MNIEKVENQNVKISCNSLSCKDENGKLIGIVRNVKRFTTAAPRVKFEYHKKVTASGLWHLQEGHNIIIGDKKLYYLHDERKAPKIDRSAIAEAGIKIIECTIF